MFSSASSGPPAAIWPTRGSRWTGASGGGPRPGRRIPVLVDGLDEELPDLLLPCGEHRGLLRRGDVNERMFVKDESSPSAGRRQLAGAEKERAMGEPRS